MNPWEMEWVNGQPRQTGAAPTAGLKPWEMDWGNGVQRQTQPAPAPATGREFYPPEQADAIVRDNPLFTRLAGFTAGLPFVGEWLDEGADLIKPGAGEQIRRAKLALETARPGQDAALRLGGGVAGSVAAAPLAVVAAPSALGLQVAAGVGAGGVLGGLESASSAAGRAEPGKRVQAALDAAPMGALVGAGVGGAAPMVSKGVSTAWRALKGKDTAAISRALGIDKRAAAAVKAALDGEDVARAGANLRRAGPDAMLMEGGPSLQSLGKGTMASGGEATRIMRQGVDDRVAGAAAQMKGVLDDSLGVPAGRFDLAAGIRRATKAARGAAYDAAYATPIDYSSEAGRRIEGLLARLPSRAANAAIQKANERIAYEGGAKQIMASIGDDGRVVFKEMPNAQQLDHLKRAFDRIVKDGTDVTGKLSDDAQFAATIARDLRNAHAAANPAYRTALRTGMDSIQSEEAVETGYKALTVTPEVLRKGLTGLNADARKAARLGVRQYIDDQMSAARAIMSRPGMEDDVGEAMKAIRELGSRRSRDNLTLLVGKAEADKLIGQVDELKTAFEIGAAMSRNSDTAVNQSVQRSIDRSAQPSVVGRLMAGEPLKATKRFTQLFTGATPEAQQATKAGIYADIARALTSIKGPDAERALTIVNRAMSGQQLTDAQAQAAGQLVATVLGAAGYREGTRVLGTHTPR